jgi:hypothetical protein
MATVRAARAIHGLASANLGVRGSKSPVPHIGPTGAKGGSDALRSRPDPRSTPAHFLFAPLVEEPAAPLRPRLSVEIRHPPQGLPQPETRRRTAIAFAHF